MTNTDLIRKAVELANGWDERWYQHVSIQCGERAANDALAAQLVRHVDALGLEVVIWSDLTRIRRKDDAYLEYMKPQSNDRTINTIQAIIESKVLE